MTPRRPTPPAPQAPPPPPPPAQTQNPAGTLTATGPLPGTQMPATTTKPTLPPMPPKPLDPAVVGSEGVEEAREKYQQAEQEYQTTKQQAQAKASSSPQLQQFQKIAGNIERLYSIIQVPDKTAVLNSILSSLELQGYYVNIEGGTTCLWNPDGTVAVAITQASGATTVSVDAPKGSGSATFTSGHPPTVTKG